MKSATVRIPATTANLGPGYDCLGVALRLHNQATMRRGDQSAQSDMGAPRRKATLRP